MTGRGILEASILALHYVREKHGLHWVLAILPILPIVVLWAEIQYRLIGPEKNDLLAKSEQFRRGELEE